MKTEREKIPLTSAIFHHNGLCIYLEADRADFWMNLGPCWGRFTNRDRLYGEESSSTEMLFLLVEVLPANEEPPHPIVSSSNVLWWEKEVFEAVERKTSFERGFQEKV